MTGRMLALCLALSIAPACAARHGAPVVDTGSKPTRIDGTIAGVVTADSAVALTGRTVTATDDASGQAYSTTTATNGGYTIKVPSGHRYRLDVELRPGEMLEKRPDPTDIRRGDVDAGRNFVITAAR